MNENQIQTALQTAFGADGHRLVLWNDTEGGFADDLDAVLPDGVELIRLPGPSMLEVKIRVELDAPGQKFLIYDVREEPPLEQDFLRDLREYGHRFSADRASVVLGELKLQQPSLVDHLRDRDAFFASKQRVKKLKTFVKPEDDAAALDRKMIAVLVKANGVDWDAVLRTLLAGLVDRESGGLNTTPAGWADVGKLGLEAAFWEAVKGEFGYEASDPNLKSLLLRVLVSDLTAEQPDLVPDLSHLRLPGHGVRRARVLVSQWADSQRDGAAWVKVAQEGELELGVGEHLAGCTLETLLGLTTFPCTERTVVASLVRDLIDHWQTPHTDAWRHAIKARRDGHWVKPEGSEYSHERAFALAYEAIEAAVDLIEAWHPWTTEPWPSTLEDLWARYTTDWWRIDRAYRLFTAAAQAMQLNASFSDGLKGLAEVVERIYVQGYLDELAQHWGGPVAERLADWQIEDVGRQADFFAREVQPRLDEGARQKVMVIVSDALRYEAARDLAGELNGRYRFEAELDAQLGVVPSYTTLGMAALLPHDTLAYAADGKTVRVDGQSAASTPARAKVLAAHEGTAVQAEDLLGLTKKEGRERLEGARVVYVYHNTIDAAGDSASTESTTFAATKNAIDELAGLVNKAVNSFNFNYVVVTADHGFLFTQSDPNATDKSRKVEGLDDAVLTKKRYVLGRGLPSTTHAWAGSTAQTAGTDPGMDFLIPRGTSLFHFVGGARFIHGGAMPQEIVVPVIRVKARRGASAESTRIKKMNLQILGGPHRITTGQHRFKLMQLEPASERVHALKVRVEIRDGDEPVSDAVTMTFESTSESYDDRTQECLMTLKNVDFDAKRVYTLGVRQAGTGNPVTHADIQIQRAFRDEF